MTVDIIILSNAKNEKLKAITQQAVDTCHKSEKDIQFNIVVLEQQENVKYDNCVTGYVQGEFNYNKFMNVGISLTGNQYIALCNNDLLFTQGWATNIIKAMKDNYLLSASPLCQYTQGRTFKGRNNVEYGYSNAKHLSGWCIVIDRLLIDIIGNIDEDFPFWFADNAYAEQLKKHEVKHALVRDSIVNHLGSKTLKTNDEATKHDLTMGWAKKFIEKYPNNESAIHFKRFI
jgi:GT2 family glycosyltransferase